jgi:MscS family membrane protein
LYDYFISSPGYLIPYGSFLFRVLENFPPWIKTIYSGQMLWKWIGLLLCVLGVALSAYMIFRIVWSFAKRLDSPKNHWLMFLAPIIIMIIVFSVEEFIKRSLRITGEALNSVTVGGTVIVVVMVIWAVFNLCRAVAETIIALPRMKEESLDASLLRIAARFLAFVIGGWIVIVSLRDLGADLLPLLAGLGVGGLAVALAAQRTLANFIGSLILFATKPVKPGDFCRYGDQIGTVEHMGLLSTRIRSLERTIITVPNAEFSEMKLDNFTLRDQRLLNTTLQLRYETTPEQMRYILAKLRELLLRHPKVAGEPARVRFVEYGAYSKDVEIFAYLRCQDQDTFLAIKEDILLRVEDVINEAGSGFAFPSQTSYLSRDTGLDVKRGSEVEAQVEQWRTGGKLPFPEFENNERRQLKDTLDYPPKGSPCYKPPAGKGE